MGSTVRGGHFSQQVTKQDTSVVDIKYSFGKMEEDISDHLEPHESKDKLLGRNLA